MFEGFSFPSSSPGRVSPFPATHNEDMIRDCDSNLVSPLSSRCPSPVLFPRSSKDHHLLPRHSRSQFRLGPAPTSMPAGYTDGHRLSIGTLTQKLHAQTLDNEGSSDSDEGRGFPVTPPRSARGEVPSIYLDYEPLSPTHVLYRERGPSWSSLSPTSTPKGPQSRSSSLHTNDLSLHPNRSRSASREDSIPPGSSSIRDHRETLSIIQCTASTVAETVRLALLMEEDHGLGYDGLDEDQHPSSLPPSSISRKRRVSHASRKNSLAATRSSDAETLPRSKLAGSGPGASKVGKSHLNNTIGSSRDLRRNGRSSQGLRRRSLVLAAVAAMVEADEAKGGNITGAQQVGQMNISQLPPLTSAHRRGRIPSFTHSTPIIPRSHPDGSEAPSDYPNR
ncbi:hypothetical protein AJ80_06569 [Polytolypa hystricis UAMH7299]|uniref:Uncharacterized protein n=1 Tax=Polytolypa hystricis (strain UAMH7299) TaxID=1447883 RepID=A0A2B7XV31_POLH7|nr:hypothetical protein AJ80_06569 [Polytolypa hystricis UAMH7299]